MGVSGVNYDKGMIESALFRSGGVKLADYAYGPALPPGMRSFKAQGSGVGHVYIHVKGDGDDLVGNNKGLDKKSKFADTNTAILAMVEVMKAPVIIQALANLDMDPQVNDQEWHTGIAVTGAYYGFTQHSDVRNKIATVAINLRSHGDALFISSCYPDGFFAGPLAPGE